MPDDLSSRITPEVEARVKWRTGVASLEASGGYVVALGVGGWYVGLINGEWELTFERWAPLTEVLDALEAVAVERRTAQILALVQAAQRHEVEGGFFYADDLIHAEDLEDEIEELLPRIGGRRGTTVSFEEEADDGPR